ncbi:MAG: AI-2E family transporter [Vitreoscilla sp.]|nr:AI-2E family transporter [Burkholderiales bacterium]MBP6336547.1 AI-2E family transporter [Vitreoscilla sp.]MBP6673776.1 AI-2E family transporter [Vitreoscilla sp.]
MNLTPAQRQTVSWLLIAAALFALLWLLAPVLAPFLVAAVLAYALHPAVEALARRLVPRALAVSLVVVLAGVAALALLLLIVPILARELPMLREQIPLGIERLGRFVSPWLAQFGMTQPLDMAGLKTMLMKALSGNLEDWATTLLSSARIGGSIVLTIVGNLVLVPLVLFYLLLDWPQFTRRLHLLVPPRLREPVDGFLGECDELLGQYLRGQLLVMLSLSLWYTVTLAIAGLELALPVGLFTGLLIFIPYLGFGLGLLLALLTALLQFNGLYGLAVVAVVYGLGQVLESFILTPRLVGERIGLNPLAVIFALLAFGQLFGFVGVLAALPLSALAMVAARRVLKRYLASELYRG